MRSATTTSVPANLDFSPAGYLYATHPLHAFAARCPPPLADWAITRYSAPGEVVLDPMAGSGTTMVEGCLLGRKAWGVEIDPLAHRIANPKAQPLVYDKMLTPGRVSIIDLSDTDSPQVSNLVIAEILRGVQVQQESSYRKATAEGKQPTPVMVFIEEAHQFLSQQRIKQMEVLFQQVAQIARRGRKRWLGLAFVTQLPQHLPDEALGLINNWVLHKINDANVVSRLRRSIGGIDQALWDLLPSLSPGQAIVSFTSLARPVLVAVDPTPCRLLMVE